MVSYHVYTPEAYDQSDVRLPVLYWLHGTDGGLVGIPIVAAQLASAIARKAMPPMIVVFVNGLPRRLWADSKDGSSPVETVFIREVIPDVDRNFRTVASRRGRIVEGFSMGGFGAARLGFRHPDLFGGISILAGGPLDPEFRGPRAAGNPALRAEILQDVCSGDLSYFRSLSPWTLATAAAATWRRRTTVVRQVVGERDETADVNRRFHEHMVTLGIVHRYVELPGVGHDASRILEVLAGLDDEFYRQALGSSASAPLR